MTMRSWLIVVGIVLMAGLNGFLISTEHIDRIRPEVDDIEYDDRLSDLVYSKSNREQNLAAFGLNESQVNQSRRYFKRYEDMERQILGRLTQNVDAGLADIFCSRTEELRPRYAALGTLILMENGERIIWDPKEHNSFEVQAWVSPYSLESIYADVEKGRSELPASTAMVVTAFVAGVEDSVVTRLEPWGRSSRSWDWELVQTKYAKNMNKVVEYLSILHYVTEMANSEKGICQ